MTHFNPLPPRRERQDQAYIVYAWINFNPLPPRRGRQWRWRIFKSRMMISIHSLLAEGDVHACKSTYHQYQFQSTPSSQRETSKTISIPSFKRFQSTPSSQRETVYPHKLRKTLGIFQSTPSSQRETAARLQQMGLSADFNPLPPRRGRLSGPAWPACRQPFQSTPSSQRETIDWLAIIIPPTFQSTPSSQRETDRSLVFITFNIISIHSLLAEGDPLQSCGSYAHNLFQSTPSSQRETAKTHKNTSCPLTYYTQNPQ